jgi:S-DNA-T family DNA segregation ATPase FtsK/SpoIIIE
VPAKDSLVPADDDAVDAVPTDPPRRRKKKIALPPEPAQDEHDDDDLAPAAPAPAEPVHMGSQPPRLVIAEPLTMKPSKNDDDDDDDDEVAKAPRRARRRPRPEHVSQPPAPADVDDDDSDSTSPEQPAARKGAKKAVAKKKASKKTASPDRFAHLPLEITGIVVFALGVLSLLSLLSYSSKDTAAGRTGPVGNWIGPGGAVLADLLTLTLGIAAFLVPLALVVVAVVCFRPVRQPRHAALRAVGGVSATLSSMTLLHLLFRGTTLLPFPAGGLLGALLADGGSRFVAPLGTGVVAVAVTFVGGLIALDRPLGLTTRGLAEKLVDMWNAARERVEIWREERRLLLEEEERLRKEAEAEAQAEPSAPPVDVEARKQERKQRIHAEAERRAKQRILDGKRISVAPVGPSAPPVAADAPPTAMPVSQDAPTVVDPPVSDPPWVLEGLGPAAEPRVDGKVVSLKTALQKKDASDKSAKRAENGDDKVAELSPFDGADAAVDVGADPLDDNGPLRIVERQHVDAKAVVEAAEPVVEEPAKTFHLPPLNLLDYDAPPPEPLDEAKMRTQADKLIAKFKDFGIEGRIREIRPGPVVTTYELVPAPGIKVSKIAALADDIAMAMEAIHVRIVAPIPGKGAVGIEIPNEKRETVYMKEIIADAAFKKREEKLMMALGKDIEGRSYYANLAEMPHVLISGTTGSGKSVSVNAMICSILYRSTPEEVRFLMIDPKMLELSIYDGIPHLLLPPIIDSKKAAVALKWAVGEMERRYQLMSELGVRDMAGFNQKVLDAKEGKDPEAKKKLTEVLSAKGNWNGMLEKLPYIVIIIDEYADLLAVAGKDVEGYVMRLAQKARAAGLHVMLATQRPSVDVITGVIKANFPVRMGFRLASSHDSKTIINRPGAEKLLGRGDMLFMPPGTSNVHRVHGAFISEKELHRVVEFLKEQKKPDYDMSILTAQDDEEGGGEGGEIDEPKDARYDEAVAVVARTRKCSTSWLQRMMNLGYQRAARIVDRMEREGLVGPAQNAKGDREIYVKPDQLPPPSS